MKELRFNFQKSRFLLLSKIRPYRTDILLVTVLAVVAGLACYSTAQLIAPSVSKVFDIWFDGDSPRVFSNMTSRTGEHYRVKVHPLFSLIAYTAVFGIRKVCNIAPSVAVTIVMATVASIWITALFIALRLMEIRRWDALVFSILGAISASSLFWFIVPETYSFGSVSILLALIFVILTESYQFSAGWYVFVSALTLSFTTTNWMVGILATAVNHRPKRSFQITVNAFALVTVLWAVQKVIFPTAVFFLGDREEKGYVSIVKSPGDYLNALRSFFSHTMVMPAIRIKEQIWNPEYPFMVTQTAAAGSGSSWGAIAVGLWMALLGLGLWGFFSSGKWKKLRLVLGISLLAQLALHFVYGKETFLYSLHFLPFLILLAGFSLLGKARPIALLLAGALIVCAGINNGLQLQRAIDYFSRYGTPRSQVQAEMSRRPADPWPRGTGHVVLALPGTREEEKAYHEPGGNFSPSVGSFGVSLWLVDSQGKIQVTSESIPLDRIRQQLVFANDRPIPGILTETNDYRARWSSLDSHRWRLDLRTPAGSARRPTLVIRSVGPAGGEIRSLQWNGERLLVNHRWIVRVSRAPAGVYLGDERTPGWREERSPATEWTGENGWGYARLELDRAPSLEVTIEDTKTPTAPKSSSVPARSALELDLPDRDFIACLNAQIAHIMMGLVGEQTRPGDPTNYPLPWQRDGAYTLVALARAGRLETARELSTDFARNDFFGGFGPEADAPGLGIWALTEVAERVNDPRFDRWLWPHVHRKAEFILRMMTTRESIYQPVTSPVVPKVKDDPDLTLVAEPSSNGLIIGRMDRHRPLLFVNAVSYRGLLDAASLADRLDRSDEARRWRTAAAKLQRAWIEAFRSPESENDRTYISGLWQTSIAAPDRDRFRENMEKRWKQRRDERGEFRKTPLWTYFDLAEAHQWLFLNRGDRAWTTWKWFVDHQASPGLYTWWEGEGEENSSGRWERVRGWVDPPHVTPHYWTAAEMFLLQLDMLARVDRSTDKPTLSIGEGIPRAWLDRPMTVKGLSLPIGRLDWHWDGKRMDVKIQGEEIPVRLGSVFPPNTPVNISIASEGKE